MISITPEAINKAKNLRENSDTGLRVKVLGGGCSGLEYVLSFDYYDDILTRGSLATKDIYYAPFI